MLHNPDKKTKIDLPEELLCAYVDGQTTPQEDREMLEMMAADDNLAMMHDDLETIMEIINMEEEEAIPVSDSQACVNDDFDGIFDCDYESVDICHYSCCPSSQDMAQVLRTTRHAAQDRRRACRWTSQRRRHQHVR